jgi:transcriptional regulator GlxA family with amidase domain
MTQIAFLLYPQMTALDFVGPYEVLSRLPGAQTRFVTAHPGAIHTDMGLVVHAPDGYDDVPRPDIVVVPGGPGTFPLLNDKRTLDWLRQVHATTRWTTSVCTGSLLLGAAGILTGKRATTHWIVRDELNRFGAESNDDRVVTDGKITTAAGVSAGIDMALTLAAAEADETTARTVQLVIEYDPQPPYDSGSLAHADDQIHRKAIELMTPGATRTPK